MPKAGTKAKGQVKGSRNVRVVFEVIPEWKSLVLPGMDAYRVKIVPRSRGGERSVEPDLILLPSVTGYCLYYCLEPDIQPDMLGAMIVALDMRLATDVYGMMPFRTREPGNQRRVWYRETGCGDAQEARDTVAVWFQILCAYFE